MAATSSLTATASSPPTLLRTSPPPVLFLRPISSCSKFRSVRTKAKKKDQDEKKPPKVYSLVCKGCEGNGAISCTQCKGSGVNSEAISMVDSKLERYAGFAEGSVKSYAGAAMALASWVDL